MEAFLDLCLTDRAHTRLQGLAADAPDPVTRARIAARVLLARGWHPRAADVVDHGLDVAPGDPDLLALARAAALPAPSPPSDPAPDASFQERLATAEAFLRSGASTQSRRLLDALDREQPGHPRVADLLWAVGGEHDLTGSSLEQLAAVYGRLTQVTLPDLDADAATDEVTHVPRAMIAEPEPPPVDAFPSMFRGARRARWEEEDEGDDDTQAMRIPDLRDLADPFAEPRDEDTQILRVVTADLHAFAAAVPSARAPAHDVEEEEDGVVVLVRDRSAVPPPSTRRPLPSPAPVPRARRGAEAPIHELDMEEIDALEDVEALEVEEVEPAPGQPGRSLGLYAAGAGVLAVFGLALLLTLAWAG